LLVVSCQGECQWSVLSVGRTDSRAGPGRSTTGYATFLSGLVPVISSCNHIGGCDGLW